MEVSNDKIKEYTRRIMTARMRLLCNNGFYGLLLMYVKMNISTSKATAWVDLNDRIYFNPDFLEKISDRELDYVLMHLILHVSLKHLRRKGDLEDKYYGQAADIVVNSNILRSNSGDLHSITLSDFGGIQQYQVPGGDEGWKYSVEEVYQMLIQVSRMSHASLESSCQSAESPRQLAEGSRQAVGDSCQSAEDSYYSSASTGEGDEDDSEEESYGGWDCHNVEGEIKENDVNLQDKIWQERIMQAVSSMEKRNSVKDTGKIPLFALRYLEELRKPQVDWRTVLDDFIQEEINDYSFCPPDRRFDDSPFFLPDFNEKDYKVEKILFMIDTSGSMADREVTQCYSEIKGAIDQFNGKLEGWLGFFDASVVKPVPFMDTEDFMVISPKGGGGTSFDIIFDYVVENMTEELPVSIVILTDGYARFPNEKATCGIPVLWIINNEAVNPPWGKVARISRKN